MTRQIICKACWDKRGPMHPEDVLAGWKQRVVFGAFKKPPVHEVKFYTGNTMDNLKLKETRTLPSLLCDYCGEPITDSSGAVAITMWRPEREGEPGDWENSYL